MCIGAHRTDVHANIVHMAYGIWCAKKHLYRLLVGSTRNWYINGHGFALEKKHQHMPSHAQESICYSDKVLAGIVEFLRVCKDIRSRYGRDRRFTSSNCQFNNWTMNGDTVETVNAALNEKYQDLDFIATVWATILYEKPHILTLHDTSPESESFATIHTRTQAQQRLSIYVYAVLYSMDNGIFDTDGEMPTLPSLEMLQHLKKDHDNQILCTFIGAVVGLDGPMEPEQMEEFVPASSFFFSPARPLAEVMLPLDDDDRDEMMSNNGAIPQRFQAEHTALLRKIDAHFLAAGCQEYFAVESGPPIVANSYDAAMRVLPFKHAFRMPMPEHYGMFYYFWRRVF